MVLEWDLKYRGAFGEAGESDCGDSSLRRCGDGST